MTNQPYHGRAPHVRGSETSWNAARLMDEKLNAWQDRVYRLIWVRGDRGATDEELIDALKASPSTIRPRRVELREKGLIVDSGKTRATRSGRKAVVWIAKQNQGPAQKQLF